jgi:hypothetical protein
MGLKPIAIMNKPFIMMKKIILVSLLSFLSAAVFAQAANDSIAYRLERKKINAMLAQRTLKFGQYDQSLTMHTGIFGLQTKKDIRRSNDILMDIVKTDDTIYKELKILFDYSVFQRTQVQTHTNEAVENNLGFMTTINKLRNQVDQLKADTAMQQIAQEKTERNFIIALIAMFALILYLLTRKRKQRA